jgi:hypothetical protein
MPCPAHSSWFDQLNFIWWAVWVVKAPHRAVSPTARLLPPPLSQICFSILFLNTFSLCLSFHVWEQVSHLYETTGKIRVVYILIFILLDSKLEEKRFWTEG